MIDLHTHILPGMDDGSSSPSETEALLAMLRAQSVDTLAATSHFYATRETPEIFLRRREEAMVRVQTDLTVLPGAEVLYFTGMKHSSALKDLCIGDSKLLLVEMPFAPWSERTVADVLDICQCQGLQVVLAHVDRYCNRDCMGRWKDILIQEGVLFQANAQGLLRPFSKAFAMAKAGQIHFLGSDCHNLTDRAPEIGAAAAKLARKLGEQALRNMDARGREWLNL